ncbi:hypothetical protein Q3G72_012610 [Acer saccharum]|nr:hypothetical protein Q3G72_012610 [Acer saccharum]
MKEAEPSIRVVVVAAHPPTKCTWFEFECFVIVLLVRVLPPFTSPSSLHIHRRSAPGSSLSASGPSLLHLSSSGRFGDFDFVEMFDFGLI